MPVPIVWPALALIIGLPLVVTLLTDVPIRFRYPQLGRFNVMGGIEILPEFVALLLALTIYTAAFIAEVVRAGILAVPHGQTEAAQALGLAAAHDAAASSSCRRRCGSSCRRSPTNISI